jgi:PAS domain S-box-containing protein
MRPQTTNQRNIEFAPPSPSGLARLGSLPYLFGIIIFMMIGARVSTYLTQHASLRAQTQINLWQNDLGKVQEMQSLLVNAETAQRGYLIAGQSEYLDSYEVAEARLQPDVNEMPQMVSAGTLSSNDAQHLKQLIDQKDAEMDQTIEVEKAKGPAAALTLMRSGQGEALMDQIRRVIDRITGQAEENLTTAAADRSRAENWRSDVVLITGLVNVPFLLWAMWRIWVETGRRADLMHELAAQKELLSVTLRSIGDGVIVTDTEGRVTFLNVAAEELTGWASAEAVGLPCTTVFRIISEETRQAILSPVEKVLQDGAVAGLANHTILIRRDGSELPIDDSGAPMRDAQGVIRGVVLVFRDFTRHKRAEENLIRAAAELESASKAKDQFLAALSHELRTPLTPLLVILTMWEQDERISPALREDVRMMRRNVQLEARLIDDLLDLTRIAKGKLLLNIEVTDLHVVLNSVIVRFQGQMAAKSLNLDRSFHAHRHFVRADPIRIEQVMWNIVQNAMKFTPTGGTITIATRNDGDGWIETCISDDGVGMEPGILSRLFKPFEQASDDMVRRHGGLGMGLAIAQAVMQLHGGQVLASSEGSGKGSTFTVRLATTEAPSKTPRRPKPLARPRQTTPLRILLVEDHDDTSRAIARLLERSGFSVGTACDVHSALRKLDSQPWDVLVSDLGLPDSSGYELMKQVRQKYGLSVRGIAVSGYGMESDRQRSAQAGFDEHIVKPIDFEQLEEAIRKIRPPEEETAGTV